MPDESQSRPTYWKLRYLIAALIFVACVIWQLCLLGSNSTFTIPTLPTCIAILVGIVVVIMLARDPEIQLFDEAGNLDEQTSTKLANSAATMIAPFRQVAAYSIQNVGAWLRWCGSWIEKRDVSVPLSVWHRTRAVLGFWLGAAGMAAPVIWYTLDGTPAFRLAWGGIAAICISCLDLVAGGFGWRPDTNLGMRGLIQFKQFWPSIVRRARTFTRGFTGGIAAAILYGYTIAALLYLGGAISGHRDMPPGTYARGGNSDRYVSNEYLNLLADQQLANSTASFWKSAVVDSIPDRFPVPVEGETVQGFHSVMVQGLERSIQQTEALSRQSVDPKLLTLSEQLVEVDRDLIEVLRKIENIATESGQSGESVNANMAVLQGAELAESLSRGETSTDAISRDWGVPTELVDKLLAVDQRRAQQWWEIEEMQTYLQVTYPLQRFDLSE